MSLLLGMAFLLSSCRKENVLISTGADNQVVFTSRISGLPQTRAQGTQWADRDSIGIFMYQRGGPLNASTIVNAGFNRVYMTNGNGNFSPKDGGESLSYPADAAVDFRAYYPFQRSGGLLPRIDVSGQSNQPSLDFMLATGSGAGSAGAPVSLTFERQMTKLELKIKGEGLAGLRARFTAVPTEAAFDLSAQEFLPPTDVADLSANVQVNASNEAIVEWTLFPMTTNTAQQIVFTKADGSNFTWRIPTNSSFLKGHRYQYDVTLGQDGSVDPTPTVSYMEIPIIRSGANLQYSMKMSTGKNRRNFSMLYDTQNKLAVWVAYPLSGDYLGSLSRTDRWGYDPFYPQNLQANLSSGYPNNAALDIDRGHQLPSGDRTDDYNENVATFYYTNMTPQTKSLNQQVWARLEDKVRAWATQSGVDTMYVVTGGGVTTASDQRIDYVNDNSSRPVAKPKYYYKVLAMKRGTTYHTIGFRFNNVATDNRANYMNYTKTVAEIEQETGFTFFPALPAAVKSRIDTQIWN
ncbi:DNA/RNA non-specific endonuclease [Sphingobacterium bambusae]|uniref:DNA/RNA non-specific endonuclease n=2 Tax=Sphingobacterium bambusae TaxID=662858 RepID=A0ABW6B9V0_9SPHI|nr:DNA/RNA non-specific endonuclease [Sphingobacterium bambusae]WPL48586.1 DNA/RNA non-specific endonuclease [Sphingobacterium bambusae]